jgi:hypothetical protein
MKQRTITNTSELQNAANDLLTLADKMPFVITITAGTKIRSSEQNKRHWSKLESFIYDIQHEIDHVSDETGYTPLEAKKVIADVLPIEHAIILFATKKEIVHHILKQICNIPTSTRLGTKEFLKFDDILDVTMAEIIGNIRGLRQ